MAQEQEPVAIFQINSFKSHILRQDHFLNANFPIGSSNGGFTPVILYTSSITGNQVAAKIERIDHDLVRVQFDRTQALPPHPAILGIHEHFMTDEVRRCVIFQYMGEGSLRQITRDKFNNGLPGEEGVKAILSRVLDALIWIHEHGDVHKEISAGHVFLNRECEIKLGFGTTVYDDDDFVFQTHDVEWGPLLSITTWAMAPEIYGVADAVHTNTSDIWMFGVLALEIIYGGMFLMKFRERERFDNMIKQIRREGKLPKKGLDEKDQLVFPKNNEKSLLQQGLEKLILRCFDPKPEQRPTAKEFKSSIKKANRMKVFEEIIVPERLKDTDDDDAAKARMLQRS